jgi:hypothetical protein
MHYTYMHLHFHHLIAYLARLGDAFQTNFWTVILIVFSEKTISNNTSNQYKHAELIKLDEKS